jgi:hypothetical protein
MKLFQIAFIATLFSSLSSSQSFAVTSQEARDNCIKEAQETYDQCITLGSQMGAETDRTNEATRGNELLHGKCNAQLQEDLLKCRARYPEGK